MYIQISFNGILSPWQNIFTMQHPTYLVCCCHSTADNAKKMKRGLWIGQMWVSYFLIVLIGSSNTECDPTLFREGYNKLVGFVLPYLSLSLGRVEIHNTTSKYAYWPTNWILFSIVSIWVLLLTVFSLLFHYRCMFVCYSVVCTIPSCAVNHQDYIMM